MTQTKRTGAYILIYRKKQAAPAAATADEEDFGESEETAE